MNLRMLGVVTGLIACAIFALTAPACGNNASSASAEAQAGDDVGADAGADVEYEAAQGAEASVADAGVDVGVDGSVAGAGCPDHDDGGGPVFYVDSVGGNDKNNGTSASTPWQTLDKVNAATFTPGTEILFKSGSMWRGQIYVSSSGAPGAYITYAAYGCGAKPLFLGSMGASSTSAWESKSGNIWQSVATFAPTSGYTNGQPYNRANDVGNVIFLTAPGGTATGAGSETFNASTQQVDDTIAPTSQGQWRLNTSTWKVEMYSTSNPGSVYPGIELAMDEAGFNIHAKSYIHADGLEFRYYAGNTVLGESFPTAKAEFIWISDCTISWGGGGNQGGSGTRYGDSIAFLNDTSNVLVERNLVYQSYDIGITAVQGLSSGLVIHDVTTRNNIVWQSDSAQFAVDADLLAPDGGSSIYNVYTYNNTFVGNHAWDQNQRPNGPQNFGTALPRPSVTISKIIFENNTFVDIGNCSFLAESYSQGQGNFTLNYDLWSLRDDGSPSRFCQRNRQGNENLSIWAASYPPTELNGFIDVAPQFVSQSTGNFTPAPGSALRNAGKNLYASGVTVDFYGRARPTAGPFTIGAVQ